jgi:hypothetical protein
MTKRITSIGLDIIAFMIMVLGSGYQSAFAAPILGQQLYYTGGPLEITVLPYDASFTSILYLSSSPIASNSDVGKVVNIANPQSFGIKVGDELLFEMLVTNTGTSFFIGPASRNADNFAHFMVDYSKGPDNDSAAVTVEDLWGGGDKDFNDAAFRVTGGISLDKPVILEAIILATPEPASLILLSFGLLGVGWVLHRKKNQS